ncbi:MAG TPA: DUF1326 domain-containing protein [Thermoanaerobaculia bacterium]|jgi:hypothetical protein|nr:DUF1326 domain-containing protein [Thermoanaerobaculia bacterium]
MNVKAKVSIVAALVTGIAIVAAGSTRAARAATAKANTYDVTVDTIEGCSCPLFCTCYFGPSADEHMCQANNVYKFRKGSHYGDVDLSDQIVWINLDLGGEWHHKPGPGMPTEWAEITWDKKSSPAQRDAIGKLINVVFPVKWKKLSTREDTITWQDDAKTAHASMASGMSEISLDKTATNRPDKSEPVVIKNLQYWFSTSNEGFQLAPSKHHFNGADGNPKYSYENRNGFTITWTAKGEIKPDESRKS